MCFFGESWQWHTPACEGQGGAKYHLKGVTRCVKVYTQHMQHACFKTHLHFKCNKVKLNEVRVRLRWAAGDQNHLKGLALCKRFTIVHVSKYFFTDLVYPPPHKLTIITSNVSLLTKCVKVIHIIERTCIYTLKARQLNIAPKRRQSLCWSSFWSKSNEENAPENG